MSIITQLLTGRDNTTHDLGRYIAAASAVTGLGLQVYAVWRGQPFDMQAFGLGVGTLAAGVGAMLRLKADTEPDQPAP